MADEENNEFDLGALPGDPLLRHILGLVHYDLLRPRIILAVNGLVVTGIAISEAEYLGESAAQMKASYSRFISQVTELLVKRYRQRSHDIDNLRRDERWQVDAEFDAGQFDKVDTIVARAAARIEYVFLKDVRLIPGRETLSQLWRCRLDNIDGFHVDDIGKSTSND